MTSDIKPAGDPSTRSWVAFGEATSVPNIPWELEMPSTLEIVAGSVVSSCSKFVGILLQEDF